MAMAKDVCSLSKRSLKRRLNDVRADQEADDHDHQNIILCNSNEVDLAPSHNVEEPIASCSGFSNVVDDDDDENEFIEETLSEFSSDSDEESECGLEEFLRDWTISNTVTHSSVSQLLKYLKSHGHPNLPKDCRTLLKTPKNRQTINLESGQYIHFGVEEGLRNYLSLLSDDVPKELVLDFNIDGVPLTKSTSKCFWLILCRIVDCSRPVIFVVGIYYGQKNHPM